MFKQQQTVSCLNELLPLKSQSHMEFRNNYLVLLWQTAYNSNNPTQMVGPKLYGVTSFDEIV
jgi:hypothetical protein